jgi:hypothetical protein
MHAVIHSRMDWLPVANQRQPSRVLLLGFLDHEIVEAGVVPTGADADHAVAVALILEIGDTLAFDCGANSIPLKAQLHAVPAAFIERDIAGGQLFFELFVCGREQRPLAVCLDAQDIAAGITGLLLLKNIG